MIFNVVENEFHFVCKCVRYADLRTVLYSQHTFTPDLDVQSKFVNIMSTQFKFIGADLKIHWVISECHSGDTSEI